MRPRSRFIGFHCICEVLSKNLHTDCFVSFLFSLGFLCNCIKNHHTDDSVFWEDKNSIYDTPWSNPRCPKQWIRDVRCSVTRPKMCLTSRGWRTMRIFKMFMRAKTREFLRFYRAWPPSPWPRAVPCAMGPWLPGLGPRPYRAVMPFEPGIQLESQQTQ